MFKELERGLPNYFNPENYSNKDISYMLETNVDGLIELNKAVIKFRESQAKEFDKFKAIYNKGMEKIDKNINIITIVLQAREGDSRV